MGVTEEGRRGEARKGGEWIIMYSSIKTLKRIYIHRKSTCAYTNFVRIFCSRNKNVKKRLQKDHT